MALQAYRLVQEIAKNGGDSDDLFTKPKRRLCQAFFFEKLPKLVQKYFKELEEYGHIEK